MPCDEGLFVLDMNALNGAIMVVLSQIQNGYERVISYYSRLYAQADVNYCTTRKDLLAVVKGLQQLRPHVLRRHCVVRSDRAALRLKFWWASRQGDLTS